MKELMYVILIMWLISAILFSIKILAIFIMKYKELKKYYKITREDKEKFKYYRDIIKEYSIGELGYIYNKKNIDVLIKADIKKLKLQKKIEINNNNLIILNKNNLSSSELFILDSYKFIDTQEFKKIYCDKIITSLKNKNILTRINFENLLIIGIFHILTLFFYLIMLKNIEELPNQISIFIPILFVYSWCLIAVSMLMASKVSYTLTKKGKDIYLKLNGLKYYIKDFGRFNEKELKEIKLWKDYILYAIILGESDKLESQIKES